jgi:hypothetical protein
MRKRVDIMAADMAVMALTKINKMSATRTLVVTGCLVLPLAASPAAFGVEVEMGLTAGVSYTDNVFLDVSSNEIDDFVYRLSPFINIVHESPMFDANLRYRLDWSRYDDLQRSSNFQMGEANVTGNFWQESLAVEVGLQRSQVLSDPEGAIPSGRLQLASSLNDRDEWYVNPRFTRNMGRVVSLNAAYRYTEGRYDDATIQEDSNHTGDFSLENYDAGQGLTWALRYDWRRTEYEISVPFEYQQATAELGVWVNSSTRIFGAGGKESDFDTPFDPELDESFWEAGFAHTAGENLSMEFAVGDRSFGSSWRGNIDYSFRRGSTSLSYNESPTTTGINQSSGRRSIFDADDFTDFLDRPGSAERFVSKRFQWDLELQFRRSSLGLAVFDEDRSGRLNADGTPLAGQTQTGVTANFSWRAGSRTTFIVDGSVIDRESGAGSDSRFSSAGLNVEYRLGNRTSMTLSYEYSDADPLDQLIGGRDYVVNVISLLFTMTR